METTVKERPILFSGPMVRAILDGRKTQTRRVVKPQPYTSTTCPPRGGEKGDLFICPDYFPTTEKRESVIVHCEERGTYHCMGMKQFIEKLCPFGVPGDWLWVRENFCQYPYELNPQPEDAWYQADGRKPPNFKRWTPSIHMPRWASRITLEVTGVRVERIKDITDEDAQAEGFFGIGAFFEYFGTEVVNANLWVWVVEFKRLDGKTE
jgi:hypothetical protein